MGRKSGKIYTRIVIVEKRDQRDWLKPAERQAIAFENFVNNSCL